MELIGVKGRQEIHWFRTRECAKRIACDSP